MSSVRAVPKVIAIIDLDYAGDHSHWLELIRRLNQLPEDPSFCIQLRVKSATLESAKVLAEQARKVFTNDGVTLSWNGDSDIATNAGFDACHQPQASIGRMASVCSKLQYSASVHSLVELQNAEEKNVDYVVFGPVFKPTWKSVHGQGIETLRLVTVSATVPVVALGGIQLDKLSALFETEVHGIAVLSSVMDAPNPVRLMVDLLTSWRRVS